MNLAEIGRIIRKRWYVLLPMLLLASGLTAGVDKSIPVSYQSTGMVSLLASQEAVKGTSALPGTENVFLSFNSSLNDTADFLTRRINSSADAQKLAAEGVTGTYSEVLAASQGPFIALTVNGPNAAIASKEMTTLIAFTGQELQRLQQQENVPAVDMIQSAVIVPGGVPKAQTKTKLQDTAGAGIGGIALAFLVTLAANSLIESRRRRGPGRTRRGGRAGADVGGTPETGSGSDSAAGLAPDPVTARFSALNDPGDLLEPERADLVGRLPDARD